MMTMIAVSSFRRLDALDDNDEKQVELAASIRAIADSPPSTARDGFYEGIPNVEQTFDFDHESRYNYYVRSRVVVLCSFGYSIYHLMRIDFMKNIDDNENVTAVQFALWVVFFVCQSFSLVLMSGFVVYFALTFQHGWQNMAGHHLALTSTGIRFDQTFPFPKTHLIRYSQIKSVTVDPNGGMLRGPNVTILHYGTTEVVPTTTPNGDNGAVRTFYLGCVEHIEEFAARVERRRRQLQPGAGLDQKSQVPAAELV